MLELLSLVVARQTPTMEQRRTAANEFVIALPEVRRYALENTSWTGRDSYLTPSYTEFFIGDALVCVSRTSGRVTRFSWEPDARMGNPWHADRAISRSAIVAKVQLALRAANFPDDVELTSVAPSRPDGRTPDFELTCSPKTLGYPFSRTLGHYFAIDHETAELHGMTLRESWPEPVGPPPTPIPAGQAESAMRQRIMDVDNLATLEVEDEGGPRWWLPLRSKRPEENAFSTVETQAVADKRSVLVYEGRYVTHDRWDERHQLYPWRYQAYADARTGRVITIYDVRPYDLGYSISTTPQFDWSWAGSQLDVVAGIRKSKVKDATFAVASALADADDWQPVFLDGGKRSIRAYFSRSNGLLEARIQGRRSQATPSRTLLEALKRVVAKR